MLFSLPPGTEMFHFPGFPPPALYIQAGVTAHHDSRVPPFGHPRINARLTAPRGLSRPPTSFIGSWYQGIHRAPYLTYTNPHTPTRQPPTPAHTRSRKPARGPRRRHTHQGEQTRTNVRIQARDTHPRRVPGTLIGSTHPCACPGHHNRNHAHPHPRTGAGQAQSDARIRYPVHKHPTHTNATTPPTPHNPRTPPHTRQENRRKQSRSSASARTAHPRRQHPHTPHPQTNNPGATTPDQQPGTPPGHTARQPPDP
jgi:hypothetical protein